MRAILSDTCLVARVGLTCRDAKVPKLELQSAEATTRTLHSIRRHCAGVHGEIGCVEDAPLWGVTIIGASDHFRREHPLRNQRLVESGELQRHRVDAPSAPMALISKVLGFTLIAVGLILPAGVAFGFSSTN